MSHGTHSLIGVGVFTTLAWLAVHFRHDTAGRIGLCVLLSLVIAGGLIALRIPGIRGHIADLLGIGAAAGMAATGTGVGLVAIATGLGCCAHLVTDMLTDSGCPLLWPVLRYRFKLWPEPLAFTTGTRPERWLVAPALLLALGLLAWHGLVLFTRLR